MLALRVFLAGEFRDNSDGLIRQCECGVAVVCCDKEKNTLNDEEYFQSQIVWHKQQEVVWNGIICLLVHQKMPLIAGYHTIYVTVRPLIGAGSLCSTILPFVSDDFLTEESSSSGIVSDSMPQLSSAMNSRTFQPLKTFRLSETMLCNYRFINSGVTLASSGYCNMIIKEEYGSQLGSHIYDSSIVLLAFLANWFASPSGVSSPKPIHRALELGCGCGVVGIGLGLTGIASSVILSDIVSVLPYTEFNIALNRLNGVCSTVPCDWDDINQVTALRELCNISHSASAVGTQIDLIVAADVLYDANVATIFFALLYKLLMVNPVHVDHRAVMVPNPNQTRPSTKSVIDTNATIIHSETVMESNDLHSIECSCSSNRDTAPTVASSAIVATAPTVASELITQPISVRYPICFVAQKDRNGSKGPAFDLRTLLPSMSMTATLVGQQAGVWIWCIQCTL